MSHPAFFFSILKCTGITYFFVCCLFPVGVDSTSLSISNIVDIRQERNKELVMRIRTGIDNKNKNFYTDINAFQVSQMPKEVKKEKLSLTPFCFCHT